jgi:small subunit ribosomal protein S20
MASSNSSKKRIRQNVKRRALNRWRMKAMRAAIKEFDHAITHDQKDATDLFRKASAIIDRSAQKGIIHKNQASRRKSRMNKRLKGAKA